MKARDHIRNRRADEQSVAWRVKKGTKADLENMLRAQARTLGEQGREMSRLRGEVSDAAEAAGKYAAIERAVNWLARKRLKEDARKPKPEHDSRVMHFCGHSGQSHEDRTRVTTHPQAISAVLEDLVLAAEKVGADEESQTELDEERDGWERERERMLRALGMDEWEWERQGWKF